MDELPKEKRKLLRDKILGSARNFRKRRRVQNGIVVFGACILLVLSFKSIQYSQQSGYRIQDYKALAAHFNPQNQRNVQILYHGKQITLGKEDSIIKFTDTSLYIGGVIQPKNDKTSRLNIVSVPYGQRVRVVLQDDSQVWLNSGTRFVFPTDKNERKGYLEGEAIFRIASMEHHPYEVFTENHFIQSPGSTFNLKNYSDDQIVETVLKSGDLTILYGGHHFFFGQEKFRLAPGVLIKFNKNSFALSSHSIDIEEIFSWKTGVLVIKNNTLEEITDKLERYYNVTITIDDEIQSTDKFSGQLDLKLEIEEVLKNIQLLTDFKFSIYGKDIRIENK